MTPPAPPGGAPQPTDGRPRRRRWILPVVLGVVALVAVVVALVAFDKWMAMVDPEHPDYDASSEIPGAGSEEDLPLDPPSERGDLPGTTVPVPVDRPNLESDASSDSEDYRELECQFTGTSLLQPPILDAELGAALPRTMQLEPGAGFECRDGEQRSAGTIELDAAFGALDAFAGVGAGEGRITWSEVAPAERVPGELQPTSRTGVEVQLDLPVIIVWTTILDGPYAGFRGRLVLRDWELVRDDDRSITGVRFARTSTTFAPG